MKTTKPITSDETRNAVAILGALANDVRLRIMHVLSAGPSNVTGLCEALDLPQPTISHHLSLLRLNRLVVDTREGKQVIYTLAEDCPTIIVDGIKIGKGK